MTNPSRNRQKALNLLRELAIEPDEGRVKMIADIFKVWDEPELMDDLALKLDLALMELRSIDAVLARRPALADQRTRLGKIEFALSEAGRMDGLLRRYGSHESGCLAHPDGVNCKCGWAEIEKKLRGSHD